MSKPCVNCGGKFMWLQRQVITSDNDLHRIAVDVFRCQGCGYLFIVDKESKNPNRTKRFGTFNSKGYTPNEPKKTYDEEIFYGIMYINSKGKLGSKPKDYVSTKPYTIGGKTYPPIRKARVFKRKKK
jgi:hypothetical protein